MRDLNKAFIFCVIHAEIRGRSNRRRKFQVIPGAKPIVELAI